MNNITIDEVKDILKCSIDETTNMNAAIERTLQHIYLKGWNDAEKQVNKIRAEIEQLTYYWCEVNPKSVIDDVLQIIDKYKGDKE